MRAFPRKTGSRSKKTVSPPTGSLKTQSDLTCRRCGTHEPSGLHSNHLCDYCYKRREDMYAQVTSILRQFSVIKGRV